MYSWLVLGLRENALSPKESVERNHGSCMLLLLTYRVVPTCEQWIERSCGCCGFAGLGNAVKRVWYI